MGALGGEHAPLLAGIELRGGGQQQEDKHVLEPGKELPAARHRFPGRQLVPAAACKATPYLLAAQPEPRIRAEPSQNRIHLLPVGAGLGLRNGG